MDQGSQNRLEKGIRDGNSVRADDTIDILSNDGTGYNIHFTELICPAADFVLKRIPVPVVEFPVLGAYVRVVESLPHGRITPLEICCGSHMPA